MAKFYGEVGYGVPTENVAGVYDDVITERKLYGDVVRITQRASEGENVLPDLSVGNSISVLADAYANEHFSEIRYVKWNGVRWVVTSVEVQRPRLLLSLGEVYNGPTPIAPDSP